MGEFSNAQKLSAVLSTWARPAVSQIATTKIVNLPLFRSAQQSLVCSGLVGINYKLANDIMPFMTHTIDSMMRPLLEAWLSKIPDAAIPQMAHSVVDTAMGQPTFSVLDGLIEFDQEDMIELKDLLEKNLPLVVTDGYQIIK